ncbi:MAG: MarC family protein [Rhodobacteraceae bacterium]|nr:MarC family protein [Paracoccaceae bacterium]
MDTAALITAFVALFVVIDPIGLAPLFVALTRGMTPAARRAIGMRSCALALALLTVFGLLGDKVLDFIGISMPAFQIAGGALLFLTALEMLFERRSKRRQGQAQEHEEGPEDDPSVFPLAMPLIAGPGAMATMVLLADTPGAGWAGVITVHVAMIGVLAVVFAFFLAAGLLERVLGATGINVVTRLLGMLLAALSVQFVLDGLAAFGFAQT